jgi:hypothetical protein
VLAKAKSRHAIISVRIVDAGSTHRTRAKTGLDLQSVLVPAPEPHQLERSVLYRAAAVVLRSFGVEQPGGPVVDTGDLAVVSCNYLRLADLLTTVQRPSSVSATADPAPA